MAAPKLKHVGLHIMPFTSSLNHHHNVPLNASDPVILPFHCRPLLRGQHAKGPSWDLRGNRRSDKDVARLVAPEILKHIIGITLL